MRKSETIWHSRRPGWWLAGVLFGVSAVLPVASLEGQRLSSELPTRAVPSEGTDPSSNGARVVFVPPGGLVEGAVVVALGTNLPGEVELRYTTDGKTPTNSDALYHAPLVLEKSTALRVGAFRDGRLVSP